MPFSRMPAHAPHRLPQGLDLEHVAQQPAGWVLHNLYGSCIVHTWKSRHRHYVNRQAGLLQSHTSWCTFAQTALSTWPCRGVQHAALYMQVHVHTIKPARAPRAPPSHH